jgi:hypothetical protein
MLVFNIVCAVPEYRPQRRPCSCMSASAISPTQRRLRRFAGRDCSWRLCTAEWPMPAPAMRTSSSAGRRHSPAVTGTWSARACVCNSCARFGTTRVDPCWRQPDAANRSCLTRPEPPTTGRPRPSASAQPIGPRRRRRVPVTLVQTLVRGRRRCFKLEERRAACVDRAPPQEEETQCIILAAVPCSPLEPA